MYNGTNPRTQWINECDGSTFCHESVMGSAAVKYWVANVLAVPVSVGPGQPTPTPQSPSPSGSPPSSASCTTAPAIAAPSNGQTIASRSVPLSWNRPSSCSPDGYTLHINTSPDPEAQPILLDTGVGPTSYSYTFAKDGTYYWHVRACKTCTPYKPGPWATAKVVVSLAPQCSADPNKVTLYQDGNYGGACQSYDVGEYSSLGGLAGKVSSVKDPNGLYHITLFDQTGLKGTPAYVEGDTPQLTGYWNDRAQSMRIEKNQPSACSPGTDGVVLYNDNDYTHGCITVTGDVADLTPMSFDHSLSSLRFVGSFAGKKQILLYRQANFQDLCRAYWQDHTDVQECDNKIVSVQVRDYTPPVPIPVPPGTAFSGNIAPEAYIVPTGTGAMVDGSLRTEWTRPNNDTPNIYLSWAAPATIHRIVIWNSGAPNTNAIDPIGLAFSDGTHATNIQLGPNFSRCADITFPDKTVTWLEIIPEGGVNGSVGYSEVEVWATTGPQESSNACTYAHAVTPTPASFSPPPIVATAYPVPTTPSVQNLVVSAVAAESSDKQAHGADNPYLIPLDAKYGSVTIKAGAYASAPAWNGSSGGTVRFTATGTVLIDGVLTVDGKGYRGGPSDAGWEGGTQGESYTGLGGKTAQPNGGGGGGTADSDSGGGGGGYGTPGHGGINSPGKNPIYGGNAYGSPELTTLYLGSGGGSSGRGYQLLNGLGGKGGGAISITAGTITVHGRISANGADGGSWGGTPDKRGGGGGSIRLHADTVDVGTTLVTAAGGHGGYGAISGDPSRPASGGDGGDGRIRIEYHKSLTGTASPGASTLKY